MVLSEVEGIDCLALPPTVSSGYKAESMPSPVVEKRNVVKAVAWANMIALSAALTFVGVGGGPAWGDGGPDTTVKKTVYLANPYGFSAQQREGPLQAIVAALEAIGAEVWEPFTRNNQIDRTTPGWAYRIGQADLRDVRDADGLFAVVNGCPPDEGVMVELGMAVAWDKPVFLFRDDFRRCTDSEAYPLNLMVFTGLPEAGWQAYWYGSLNELADPDKALARWLKDGTLP
ncbi:MAG: nucleoside 2-deoxyribosyltransferase [Nitrospira sp.]|nr:nucleoside 2-deoxyribosyltransferase [Nitrospira sp.]